MRLSVRSSNESCDRMTESRPSRRGWRTFAWSIIFAFVVMCPSTLLAQEKQPAKKIDEYVVFHIMATGTRTADVKPKLPPQLRPFEKNFSRILYANFVAKEIRIDLNKKPKQEFPLPEKLGRCQVLVDKNGRVQFRLFYKDEKKGRGSYVHPKQPMIFHDKKYRTAKGEQYLLFIMKKPVPKKKPTPKKAP